MKKRLIFLIFAIALTTACTNNNKLNQTVVDQKTNNKMLIGYCNRQGLTSEPFNIWFNSEYNNYDVDSIVLDSLPKKDLKNLKITIVMATWCGDSRREVPRFYKIIDKLGFNEQNITLININREKKVKNIDIKKFDISRIPTFIFYKDNREIGRIIETPKQTLEKDLLRIVSIK